MHVEDMARERQINFRVSDDEMDRFDRVAAHYGLGVSAMVRMLVKQKDDELQLAAPADDREDDFRWKEVHTDIVRIVAKYKDPVVRDDIEAEMANGETWSGVHYGGEWTGLALALNQLTRNGYVRRLKTGYVITEKGRRF
jgi:antitoxin component of RelBE/YafQ-DinJ toxin-antitoxin module